jgi:hypothetical protein
LISVLNRIDADNIAQFYQSGLSALVTANNGTVFDDDLTLFLVKQQVAEQQFTARAITYMKKLAMRWMKRNNRACTTTLPELPRAANV